MKKLTAIICALAMILMLCSCTGSTEKKTVTGKVTKIDGTKITLLLGEITEATGDAQTPPEKPDGESGNEQGTPPEKPDGESGNEQGTPPEKPDGESGNAQGTPSEKPDVESGNAQGTPPEKSDGESGNAQGTPPEKPDGESGNAQGTPPEKPDGESGFKTFTAGSESVTFEFKNASITSENFEEAELSDITVGTVLTVETDGKSTAISAEVISLMTSGTPSQGGFGGSQSEVSGSAANTINENKSVSNVTYSSSGDDENALLADGAEITLDGVTVEKSGGASSNTENGDFYGVNAALLAKNGATLTIKNSTVTSSAKNGNGIFSYGSGTTVNISDTTITTSADNSGGIQTTGGGATNAKNLTVTTSGNSSAAIRSDRGGGTVSVDGGTYTSNGYNSPAVYSTAAITVKNAALTANNSEALVIEGKNSITLENCTVQGNMSDTKGSSSDENVHNVMIYQSMSGDADVGTSEFTMTGGKLISKNGDMFYVTNTHCIIKLSGVEITNADSDGYLLNVCGNSASHGWGTAGKNGAQVEFTADSQTLAGNIVVDSISTLEMTLTNSTFTGTINIVENAQNGENANDNAVITIGEGSVMNLTGNCTVSSLENHGTINFNGYTITLADGTVLSE